MEKYILLSDSKNCPLCEAPGLYSKKECIVHPDGESAERRHICCYKCGLYVRWDCVIESKTEEIKLNWIEPIGGGCVAEENTGYISSSNPEFKLILPSKFKVGDKFSIMARRSGGWKIVQAAGQKIIFGYTSTTIGEKGGLSSLFPGDFVTLVCIEENLVFKVAMDEYMGDIQVY